MNLFRYLVAASIALVLFGVGVTSPSAESEWYIGGVVRYGTRNTATSVQEQVQESLDKGLDWVVMADDEGGSAFHGIHAVLREADLNAPRLSPILGTVWGAPGQDPVLLFGVDPRSPMPRGGLNETLRWSESQGGASVLQGSETLQTLSPMSRGIGLAFMADPSESSWWEPGGNWDRALTAGSRVTYIGGWKTNRAPMIRTYVRTSAASPTSILKAVRRGAVYVDVGAETILDLRVNGTGIGGSAPVSTEAYVRIRASCTRPIGRVRLVADGEVVWTAHPESRVWEQRFFLPLSYGTYLRAILESVDGSSLALSNPIFLVSGSSSIQGELPDEVGNDGLIPDPIYPEIDGALEILARMEPSGRKAILAELLRDPSTRHDLVRVIEVREDLVDDSLLWSLVGDPDPEVRLGSAYALVVRSPADLGALLQRLLKDPEAHVRQYAARMMSQFIEGHRSLELLSDREPSVQAYLIRALDPESASPPFIRLLIGKTRSEDLRVSAAAVDKLTQLGTRSYRVIRAMLDSAQTGNHATLDPVGWIGDRRTIPDLEKLYRREDYGPLRRSAFLALERLGVPYLDRPEVVCPKLLEVPVIDGRVLEEEWATSGRIERFAEDVDGMPYAGNAWSSVAHDSRNIYLSFVAILPDSSIPHARVRERDDPGVREDDRVEWSFGGTSEKEGARTFSVTTLGVVGDDEDGDPAWNPKWQAVALQDSNRWTVECRIPLSELARTPSSAGVIPFNVAFQTSPSARWTWSVTYDSPHRAVRFGSLILGAPMTPEG